MAYTRVLRTYRYIDKNPVIDEMKTIIQDEGLMKRLDIIADLASLSRTTPVGWFDGDVRDPRHSSIMAVMTSLGYEYKWNKSRKIDYEKEVMMARAWLKRERVKRKAAAATTQKKRNGKKA